MGLRLPSTRYFVMTQPRCVFQLEIFFIIIFFYLLLLFFFYLLLLLFFFFYSKQPDTTRMCHLKTKHVILEAVSRQSVNL